MNSNDNFSSSELAPSILLVDDDLTILRSLKLILNLYGYSVETINTGSEAIEIITQNPTRFSLILLDVMMPDMNGYEVLTKLKNLMNKYKISIIVHTGIGNKDEREKVIKLGAKGLLTKPHKIEELIKIIESYKNYH